MFAMEWMNNIMALTTLTILMAGMFSLKNFLKGYLRTGTH